ncbi:transglycosylase SLT domain-containing protein [Hyphococcus sp.]|uniref:lytic transglycosylase domain-containing protein n=1 Tax=Hyphococcus sp. TaxID=2038636 RepID=UPI003751C770
MMRSAPKGMANGLANGLERRFLRRGANFLGAAVAVLTLALGLVPNTAEASMASLSPRVKPPAPGPAYMTRGDKERLLAAAAALKARQYPTAVTLIDLVSDPIAKGLGQWMYFMAEDPSVDFNVADSFLDSNPDWPARARIHAFVEKKIPSSAPADQVLAFFDSREPVTGIGKLRLAKALFAVGDKIGGEQQIRDAWLNETLTLAEEKQILADYANKLTKEDHAARVDRLLWGRQVTNARRVFPYLDSDERRKAEARSALLLQASTAQKLYDRLPENDKLDPGVLLAAVRYHRRRGEEQYALALASMAPEDPDAVRDGGRWWSERNLLMRWALKNGRFADAYTVAADHRMTEGADYAEAEFYAGWIALRFLNAPERAEIHFKALASEVASPISTSRAQYWLGRAAAAQGHESEARIYYANAAQNYYSYYGQLAAEAVGGAYSLSKFPAPVQSSPEDRALFSARPTVAALRILSDLDLEYEFMVFAYHVDDQLERPGEYMELAKLTDGEGAPHLTVRAGKVAIQRGAFSPEVAYPLVFVPDEASRFVAPEIILGLSRQESEFNPRAFSRAGARGVMQLIPTTAQITARKEGMLYSRNALLDDPVYNMTIGSAHVSHLMDRFDGSLIMTLAAYNAGAARVDQWVTQYGDPRSDAVDPLDWVELIPFSETRNYVQRVLENIQVYRGRLSDKPIPGRLQADIERGGALHRVAKAPEPSLVLAQAAAPYGTQALPPLPARTADRARRYAMRNPLHMPGDIGAPLIAPGNDLKETSPIAFSEEPLPSRRNDKNTRQSKVKQTNDEVPTLAPVVSPSGVAAAEPPVVTPAIIAPSDLPPDLIDKSDFAFTTDETTSPITETMAADTTPNPTKQGFAETEIDIQPILNEDIIDGMNDLSIADADMDSCLTYRDFIARNAEEDAESADLNAGMLAELQSGSTGCGAESTANHPLGGH